MLSNSQIEKDLNIARSFSKNGKNYQKIKNIPYVFVKKFCIVMVSKILFLLNTTKGTKKNKGGQYELQKVFKWCSGSSDGT